MTIEHRLPAILASVAFGCLAVLGAWLEIPAYVVVVLLILAVLGFFVILALLMMGDEPVEDSLPPPRP